jgi:tetratricopeptide (TPR) repeat protein
MLYNAAYIDALFHHQQSCFERLRSSLIAAPDPRAVVLMSRLLRSIGQPGKALELCRASRSTTPPLEVEAVLALLQQGALPTEVKAACQKVVDRYPADAYVVSSVVKVLVRLGDQPAATGVLGAWAEVAGECAEFYGAFAQVCVLAQDFHSAQRCLSFAIELEPQRAEWHAFLSLTYTADGRREKAAERAKWAVEVDPDCEAAWRALASACDERKEEAEKKADELANTTVGLERVELMFFTHCD